MVVKLPGAPSRFCAVRNSFSKSACDFALPWSSEAPELKPMMVSCARALPMAAAATASAVEKRMFVKSFEGETVFGNGKEKLRKGRRRCRERGDSRERCVKG